MEKLRWNLNVISVNHITTGLVTWEMKFSDPRRLWGTLELSEVQTEMHDFEGNVYDNFFSSSKEGFVEAVQMQLAWVILLCHVKLWNSSVAQEQGDRILEFLRKTSFRSQQFPVASFFPACFLHIFSNTCSSNCVSDSLYGLNGSSGIPPGAVSPARLFDMW